MPTAAPPLRFEDLLTATAGDDSVRTRCLRAMLVSMTEVADNRWAAAVDALALAFDLGEDVDDRDVLWNLGNAALQLGDDEGQRRFYSHALSRARESGAVTAVIYCLQRLCFVHFAAGDHLAVRVSAEEALALGEGIGQPRHDCPPCRVAGAAGRPPGQRRVRRPRGPAGEPWSRRTRSASPPTPCTT